MLKKPEISLIICTHNRAEILDNSLIHYSKLQNLNDSEILVVANACEDDTLKIVRKHQMNSNNLRMIEEAQLGHSNARNAGYKNATGGFVFYIDDDAYPRADLLRNLQDILEAYNPDCISGHTVFWKEDSPNWITKDLVEIPMFRSDTGPLPEKGYINGCACGFRKELLLELNGFNPDIGMSGSKLGYFDEIYMQQLLLEKGHNILYSPELIVFHKSHQKSVREFMKSAYTKGQNENMIKTLPAHTILRRIFYESIKGLLMFPWFLWRKGVRAGLLKSCMETVTLLGKLDR